MTLDDVKIRHTHSESEVRSFYQDDIAPACRKMASMLGLGINNETVFGWSTNRPEQKRAMADGFLSLKAGPTTLRKDLRAHIDLILYWKLDILVLWEFKSLAAGCRGVMMAIRQLAIENSFVWTACTPSCHCNPKKFHPHNNPRFVKAGRKTGPDARSPPWTFISPREKKRSFDDMCKLDDGGDYIREGEDDLPDGDPTEGEYPVSDSVKETDVTKAHNILQQVSYAHFLHLPVLIFVWKGLGRGRSVRCHFFCDQCGSIRMSLHSTSGGTNALRIRHDQNLRVSPRLWETSYGAVYCGLRGCTRPR